MAEAKYEPNLKEHKGQYFFTLDRYVESNRHKWMVCCTKINTKMEEGNYTSYNTALKVYNSLKEKYGKM